jgi:Lipocalin-like domain
MPLTRIPGRKMSPMRLAMVVATLGVMLLTLNLEGQGQSSPLVGTWRVVKYCDRDSTGAMVEPLGPNPTGLFVYTPTGQLSIQAMRTPPARPLAGDSVRLRSLGELRPFYFGYFGTYSILPSSRCAARSPWRAPTCARQTRTASSRRRDRTPLAALSTAQNCLNRLSRTLSVRWNELASSVDEPEGTYSAHSIRIQPSIRGCCGAAT